MGVILPGANSGGGYGAAGYCPRAPADRGAAPSGSFEETRLDGDLAQRDLDAAEIGLHDGQQGVTPHMR